MGIKNSNRDGISFKNSSQVKGVIRMKRVIGIILNLVLGVIIGVAGVKAFDKKSTTKQQPVRPTIYEDGFLIFNDWMKLKHEGKSLQRYFDDNRMKTVAIYGFGALGQRLYEDLQGLEVEVAYVIDRNAENIKIDGLKVVTMEEELDLVDAIIITPIQFFMSIERDLENKSSAEIVSIEDVVSYCV